MQINAVFPECSSIYLILWLERASSCIVNAFAAAAQPVSDLPDTLVDLFRNLAVSVRADVQKQVAVPAYYIDKHSYQPVKIGHGIIRHPAPAAAAAEAHIFPMEQE